MTTTRDIQRAQFHTIPHVPSLQRGERVQSDAIQKESQGSDNIFLGQVRILYMFLGVILKSFVTFQWGMKMVRLVFLNGSLASMWEMDSRWVKKTIFLHSPTLLLLAFLLSFPYIFPTLCEYHFALAFDFKISSCVQNAFLGNFLSFQIHLSYLCFSPLDNNRF